MQTTAKDCHSAWLELRAPVQQVQFGLAQAEAKADKDLGDDNWPELYAAHSDRDDERTRGCQRESQQEQ